MDSWSSGNAHHLHPLGGHTGKPFPGTPHPTLQQASPQMPADVHGGKAHKTETIPQCLQPRESHSSVAPAQSLAKYQAFSLHC